MPVAHLQPQVTVELRQRVGPDLLNHRAVAVNGYSEGDISTPFGGYKMSGFGGRDNGLEALEQYTELKTIWITLC